jgi:hypothetical protein
VWTVGRLRVLMLPRCWPGPSRGATDGGQRP